MARKPHLAAMTDWDLTSYKRRLSYELVCVLTEMALRRRIEDVYDEAGAFSEPSSDDQLVLGEYPKGA